MRLVSLVRKTTLENLRDWKILIMTLSFAPFFTILMHFYFDAASGSPYRLALVNGDEGALTSEGDAINHGRELIDVLELAASEESETLRIHEVIDTAAAIAMLEAGSADLAVSIPIGFTTVIEQYGSGDDPPAAIVTTYGDPTNQRYLMAAAWSDAITYAYAAEAAGVEGPIEVSMRTIGTDETLNEFDLYVPGLLALSVIMLMFTAAASIIKEKDKGTLVRLRISHMTTFEWLFSITLVQTLLGVIAVALTLVTAMVFGYSPTTPPVALLLLSAISSVAIVSISVLVAAWLRTIFDLMTIGCFPFFILMFFSGGMFPLPEIRILELADRTVSANDILPTTHSISGFDRILNGGLGLGDVWFEVVAILLLSMVYFAVGTALFARRHMSPNAV